jgi:hypothetical protein
VAIQPRPDRPAQNVDDPFSRSLKAQTKKTARRRSPAGQILLSRKQSRLSYDRLIVSGGHDEICCESGNVACDDQHVVCGWECQSFQNREREDRYRSKCLSDLR